jgi:hypothetical protein
VNVINDSSLAIAFSEYMNWNAQELKPGFILQEGKQNPDSVIVISKDSLLLKFENRFKDNCWLHLMARDMEDLFGNRMKPETDSFLYSPVKLNDICINEILPDPSPAVRLPEYEFIELFNRTSHSINLSGWTITCGDVLKTFPSFILDGNEYLVLCQSSAVNSFGPFGKSLGIFTSVSFLSNSGSCIQLHSSEGTLISQLCYSSEWITDVNKKDGGWSLERIDPEIPCSGKENWTVSKDKNGGTPGRQNSVFRLGGDHIPPSIKGIFPDTDSTLLINFSETVGLNYITNPSSFMVDHNIGNPQNCNSVQPEFVKLRLNFKNHFHPDTLYTISHNGSVQDCAGNHGEAGNYKFLLPSMPDSQDVVINEVMYHPVSGCPEFIEIYNRSKKAFRLEDFRIGIIDPYSGELKSISTAITESRLFMPAEFIVLTSKPDEMKACYPQSIVNANVAFDEMPVLTDDGQKLQLISKDLSVIDEMSYKDAMQFALLTNSIGVSLERVDYNRSSADPGNWHSASAGSGFCTPGFENSQFSETENSNSCLQIEPEIFSPNNDGKDDIVNILYSFDKPGFVGNLFIFDSKGRQVKRIANNELLACKGQFSWDGVSENGSMLQPGIYIVLFEVFNLSGKTERFKKICVVSRTR